jgi:membrane-associated protease RseP (regulator of RpoE activity)
MYTNRISILALALLFSGTTSVWGQTKPTNRASAESRTRHLARYTDDDFSSVRSLLGVNGSYEEGTGFYIKSVGPGTAAERAGLKAGDTILEVDGVPVGRYGSRTYFVWKRYPTSSTNRSVQLTITFLDADGSWRYYYPIVELDPAMAIAPGNGSIPRPPNLPTDGNTAG